MTSAMPASGSVTRNTDPHQNSSSSAPATRGPRAAIAPPSADQSAMDFVRPGTRPERGDQRESRRIRHAGGQPAADAGDEQHLVRRRVRSKQRHRDRERGAEDEHQLAPVAVAERTEIQHRRRQAERVADRDQVERHLGRVERLADRGQRDVRDGQVQIRDRGDGDKRDEDDAGTVGCCGVAFGSQVRAAHPRDSIRWAMPSRIAHRVTGARSGANPKRRLEWKRSALSST